ncbi:MAG: TetR/AcrR family transcriptional regulator [Peptostreptococcaceae bacterium]|nr:TetR/AcrR family transcriptional regulator [Peptostreptococcaceae bacterium]
MSSKSDTREVILQIAAEEFLQKGFYDASLRNIAEMAGVTTGSFYWHFKSKEELFDSVVGEHYLYVMNVFKAFIEDSSDLSIPERLKNMRSISLKCLSTILTYMYEHPLIFKILISKSSGTKYEHFIHELVSYEVDDTEKFYEQAHELGIHIKEIDSETEHILISGMFSTLFEMFIHDFSYEKACENLELLIDFYIAGWMRILDIRFPN